jgi:hypothetical protein
MDPGQELNCRCIEDQRHVSAGSAPSVIRTRDLLLRRHIGLNAVLTSENAGQPRTKTR